MDFDALMKKKLGGKYNKPSLVEILPQTEDGQDQAKPKNKGQKKATFKPRVTCSQCDFVGIDGKEMDIHRKKNMTEVLIAKSVSLWPNSGLF